MQPKPNKSPSIERQQPRVSKCESCVFRLDFSHDCLAHDQEHESRAGHWIVLRCEGWQPVERREAVAA